MKPVIAIIYKLAEKSSGSTTHSLEPIHMQLYICACVCKSTCIHMCDKLHNMIFCIDTSGFLQL